MHPPIHRRRFARLTGDDNPLHLDAAFAATTPFRRPIAHGMLYGSLIGSIMGATIPGAVYVSQDFRFRRPVYVGDTVIARVVVNRFSDVTHVGAVTRQQVTCDTTVRRASDGRVCLEGEAVLLLPRPVGVAPGTERPAAERPAASEPELLE